MSEDHENKAVSCGCGNDASQRATSTPCCGDATPAPESAPSPLLRPACWMRGALETPAGPVARAATELCLLDRWGAWKARWGVGRMRYTITPGLYAVGDPTPESPVLVTANYKMSFDRLRARLTGRDVWIVVLDTKGINVWCAAGKGTFGTEEIIQRAAACRLAEVVTHRKLILPQLGAPGVRAHEVKERAGFRVVYGPVRAEDLGEFLDAGMKATPDMRRVRFPLRERLALIPLELVMSFKYFVIATICLLLLSGLGPGFYSLERVWTVGLKSAVLLLAVYLAGAAVAPALLPWLPGRMFSLKGAWAGLLVLTALVSAGKLAGVELIANSVGAAAWLLMGMAAASFLAMNFTGASTYTSLSGVLREVRLCGRIQAVLGVAGIALWLGARFI